MLNVLRESGGTIIAVLENDMPEGVSELCRHEGIFTASERGAWAVTEKLLHQSGLQPDQHALLLNTGSDQTYPENIKGKWNR